jgi:hypothetical protein
VTRADIETVNYIRNNAAGDYIVLANQMVGAAAIRESGFAKYYGGNFYYSMPNGNENNFYRDFEKMVFNKPEREFAIEAMNLAGVDQCWLVVNDYWTNSKKIIENAKLTADDWQSIDGGANYIFRYNVN